MHSNDKLKAVFVIWMAFAVAAAVTFWGNPPDLITLFMGLFYSMAALGATGFVMLSPAAGETAQKAKRRNVERLLSSLNDDELNHLRERLSTDDGEMVTLEEVMRGQKGRR